MTQVGFNNFDEQQRGKAKIEHQLAAGFDEAFTQPSNALEPPAKENDEKNGKRDSRSEMKEAEKVTQGRRPANARLYLEQGENSTWNTAFRPGSARRSNERQEGFNKFFLVVVGCASSCNQRDIQQLNAHFGQLIGIDLPAVSAILQIDQHNIQELAGWAIRLMPAQSGKNFADAFHCRHTQLLWVRALVGYIDFMGLAATYARADSLGQKVGQQARKKAARRVANQLRLLDQLPVRLTQLYVYRLQTIGVSAQHEAFYRRRQRYHLLASDTVL